MEDRNLPDSVQREYEALFTSEYASVVDRLEFQTGSPADAEDIASRAFERLLRQLERGDAVDNLRARLNSIAEGLVINHWRDQERRREEPAGLLPDLDALAAAQPLGYAQVVFSRGFDGALRALAEPERDALILTDLRGLTVREAADVLDTSKDTVARRRMAAHTYVKEALTA